MLARLLSISSHSITACFVGIALDGSSSIGRRERWRFHSQKWTGALGTQSPVHGHYSAHGLQI